ncbi:undecaprenyl/decaprenyl-phosphate alpha-N-acetylglucosaminyl 1-phosphate transferase [Fictibacillus nanhaiensis]|uniref:glycosyltransferase family 4 protein n=1 Tax=Fictibacillus nanhaiensis TaxID=742169 RepID=UPI001C97010D|nr:MraY family glycosyltransferase [Fictibacillus nanhaiensis]MBY6037076.1 undecaprenyl/decaprenyl-phosphate alpha-N-acetylglucosaminyl 1-phosphate transferase [Fictibacillus nanhaiensis]
MIKHAILIGIICFLTVIALTPIVIKFAVKINAVDKPNQRKVHTKVMPRLGGLSIVIGVTVGYFFSGLYEQQVLGISLGALVIIVLGLLDDIYHLSAINKLLAQIFAGLIVVMSGLVIEIINIPFVGTFEIGYFSYPLTIFWIIAITNAINLIDGLDGLAAGTSAIIVFTIGIMAFLSGKEMIFTFSIIIFSSVIGFLFYNFYPAKVFMGDIGALFLGYCIAILSLLGLYKSVTLFSFIGPILLLGVPLFDTLFAIIRRIVNKQSIVKPDKGHLHHRLLKKGLSHRNSVLFIYGLGLMFSATAIILPMATLRGTILIIILLVLSLQYLAEKVGLVNERFTPFINLINKVHPKNK